MAVVFDKAAQVFEHISGVVVVRQNVWQGVFNVVVLVVVEIVRHLHHAIFFYGLVEFSHSPLRNQCCTLLAWCAVDIPLVWLHGYGGGNEIEVGARSCLVNVAAYTACHKQG